MVEVARIPAGPRAREWARQNRFSEWMVARYHAIGEQLEAQTGEEALANKIINGLTKRPSKYIRVNPLRARPKDVHSRLTNRGFVLARVPIDDQLMRIREAPISQGATYEHLAGMTTPQDMASASAGLAMAAQPDEVVVDLTASPGIKSLHLAGDMQDNGALVCVEPEPQRFQNLVENMERGGVSCAMIRNQTAQTLQGEAWADRVLVDAPCTGEGTLPKDKNRRRGKIEEIMQACSLQGEILEAAHRILRPGGTLVYSTCALAPEENEGQVQQFLDRGYSIEPLDFDALPGLTQWPGLDLDPEMEYCQRFFAGVQDSLGFFVAKLTKGDE